MNAGQGGNEHHGTQATTCAKGVKKGMGRGGRGQPLKFKGVKQGRALIKKRPPLKANRRGFVRGGVSKGGALRRASAKWRLGERSHALKKKAHVSPAKAPQPQAPEKQGPGAKKSPVQPKPVATAPQPEPPQPEPATPPSPEPLVSHSRAPGITSPSVATPSLPASMPSYEAPSTPLIATPSSTATEVEEVVAEAPRDFVVEALFQPYRDEFVEPDTHHYVFVVPNYVLEANTSPTLAVITVQAKVVSRCYHAVVRSHQGATRMQWPADAVASCTGLTPHDQVRTYIRDHCCAPKSGDEGAAEDAALPVGCHVPQFWNRFAVALAETEAYVARPQGVTVGVVLVSKPGQDEEAMFLNEETPTLMRLLEVLGDTFHVSQWDQWAGNLDKEDPDARAVYARDGKCELVYHVTPWMTPTARRQHVGNDKVLLYVVEPGAEPVQPVFRGNVNSVCIVVQPVPQHDAWRVRVFKRSGIANLGPNVPEGAVADVEWLRRFFLTKSINMTESAYRTLYRSQTARVWSNALHKLVTKHALVTEFGPKSRLAPRRPVLPSPSVRSQAVEDLKVHYGPLLELLQAPEYATLAGLIDVLPATDADKAASSMAVLFTHLGCEHDVFEWLIQREVNATDTSNTLFRGRSVAIRLVSEYCKMVTRPWLVRTLTPLLFRIMDVASRLEVDVDRMPDGATEEDADVSRSCLRREVLHALVHLRTHMRHLPLTVRRICAIFDRIVEAQFPSFAPRAIGGFLFLRLVCPAIVSPAGYAVLGEHPSSHMHRGLVLVAKVIQNISNGISFAEPMLMPLNDFMQEQEPIFRNMLLSLSHEPASPEPWSEDVELWAGPSHALNALMTLSRLLRTHLDRMEKQAVQATAFDGDEDDDEALTVPVARIRDTLKRLEAYQGDYGKPWTAAKQMLRPAWLAFASHADMVTLTRLRILSKEFLQFFSSDEVWSRVLKAKGIPQPNRERCPPTSLMDYAVWYSGISACEGYRNPVAQTSAHKFSRKEAAPIGDAAATLAPNVLAWHGKSRLEILNMDTFRNRTLVIESTSGSMFSDGRFLLGVSGKHPNLEVRLFSVTFEAHTGTGAMASRVPTKVTLVPVLKAGLPCKAKAACKVLQRSWWAPHHVMLEFVESSASDASECLLVVVDLFPSSPTSKSTTPVAHVGGRVSCVRMHFDCMYWLVLDAGQWILRHMTYTFDCVRSWKLNMLLQSQSLASSFSLLCVWRDSAIVNVLPSDASSQSLVRTTLCALSGVGDSVQTTAVYDACFAYATMDERCVVGLDRFAMYVFDRATGEPLSKIPLQGEPRLPVLFEPLRVITAVHGNDRALQVIRFTATRVLMRKGAILDGLKAKVRDFVDCNMSMIQWLPVVKFLHVPEVLALATCSKAFNAFFSSDVAWEIVMAYNGIDIPVSPSTINGDVVSLKKYVLREIGAMRLINFSTLPSEPEMRVGALPPKALWSEGSLEHDKVVSFFSPDVGFVLQNTTSGKFRFLALQTKLGGQMLTDGRHLLEIYGDWPRVEARVFRIRLTDPKGGPFDPTSTKKEAPHAAVEKVGAAALSPPASRFGASKFFRAWWGPRHVCFAYCQSVTGPDYGFLLQLMDLDTGAQQAVTNVRMHVLTSERAPLHDGVVMTPSKVVMLTARKGATQPLLHVFDRELKEVTTMRMRAEDVAGSSVRLLSIFESSLLLFNEQQDRVSLFCLTETAVLTPQRSFQVGAAVLGAWIDLQSIVLVQPDAVSVYHRSSAESAAPDAKVTLEHRIAKPIMLGKMALAAGVEGQPGSYFLMQSSVKGSASASAKRGSRRTGLRMSGKRDKSAKARKRSGRRGKSSDAAQDEDADESFHQPSGAADELPTGAPDEKSGWLLKKLNKAVKPWKRRWAVLEDGKLYIKRDPSTGNGLTEAENVLNVSFCSPKECVQKGKNFCFQLVTLGDSIIFSCVSAQERAEWMSCLREAQKKSMSRNLMYSFSHASGAKLRSFLDAEATEMDRSREAVRALVDAEGNSVCADCGADKPRWAVINHGIFICIECSGIHRRMGVHISQVRSVTMDVWEPSWVQRGQEMGNVKSNLIFEATYDGAMPRPAPGCSMDDREAFIRAKYEERRWASADEESDSESACSDDDVDDLAALAAGVCVDNDASE